MKLPVPGRSGLHLLCVAAWLGLGLTACSSSSGAAEGATSSSAGAPVPPAAATGSAGTPGPAAGSGVAARAGAGSGAVGAPPTPRAGTPAGVPAVSGGAAGVSAAGSGAVTGAAGTPAAGSPGSMMPAAGSGGSATPAAGSSASAGTATGPGKVFSECRFHFGSIADVVRNDPATVKELDFFTTGWMGLKDTFDMDHVCKDTAPGATFEGKLPVIVSYVAAFYAKRNGNLKDCNAPGSQQDLCTAGAGIIMRDLTKILAVYESYAQGFAKCYGTSKPIVFEMEPDFFQYTISNQQQAWSPMQAGQIMGQFVAAIKKHLPNAVFSMDISPWVPPDNGSDGGKQWFSNFDMSLFTFVNTSGGHTDGGSAQIRQDNKMTWSGVSMASGKAVLADTGYGVNGRSEGPDPVWNNADNINARIRDGVVSISQYNPAAGWGSEIAAMRAKLGKPSVCP